VKNKEEKFTYFAAEFEEDTKRREEDGNNDINEGSCAHFFSFEVEGRKKLTTKGHFSFILQSVVVVNLKRKTM
jgi:hypothetical protein